VREENWSSRPKHTPMLFLTSCLGHLDVPISFRTLAEWITGSRKRSVRQVDSPHCSW